MRCRCVEWCINSITHHTLIKKIVEPTITLSLPPILCLNQVASLSNSKMAQLVMGLSYKALTFFWVNRYSHMFIYPHSLERITFLLESIDLMHDLVMFQGCQTNWDFTCLQICNNMFLIIYVLGNCYWCKQSFPLWSIPQNVILTLSPSFNAI